MSLEYIDIAWDGSASKSNVVDGLVRYSTEEGMLMICVDESGRLLLEW